MPESAPSLMPDADMAPDPERAYALPAPFYTEGRIAELERDRIFRRTWQWVCHVSEIANPGDYVTARVSDQDLIVIRGKDRAIRAFYNVCSHRAHELLKGRGNAKVITCPYHAWSYHADGRLRTARGAEHVAGFDHGEFALRDVRVEEFHSLVFVNLDADARLLALQARKLAPELEAWVPDMGALVHAHRLTFSIASNWKNVIDNFLECYHCPTAHPAFVELIDMKRYKVTTHDIHSSHMSFARSGSNSAYDVSGADVTAHAVWWLWPNLCLLRFPGSGNIMVLNVVPDGVERTFETYDFYFLQPAPDEQQREAIRYIEDVLQPEDIAIVESVQRGQHSLGCRRSRLMVDRERSYWSEHGLHHFHALLHGALTQGERSGSGPVPGR